MLRVSFYSVPEEGVSIYIDGVPIEDYELADQFREECLSSDGKVICDWQTLHDNWLITKKLSKIWWLLTDEERDHVSYRIVASWLFTAQYTREGEKDCKGGRGEWGPSSCLKNAIIRYLRFGRGEKHYNEISHCYWSEDKKTEHCFWEESYDLPVYICNVYTEGPGFGHAIAAFQIRKDPKDFNSWRFFQYSKPNIEPGDWNMPCSYDGKTIYVNIAEPIRMNGCGGCSIKLIAKWRIDKETCEPVPE